LGSLVALDTVTVVVNAPGCVGISTISTVVPMPIGSVPIMHSTDVPVAEQEPCSVLTDDRVIPAGIVAVRRTPCAGPGPSLAGCR
jgi:hypothetical protein